MAGRHLVTVLLVRVVLSSIFVGADSPGFEKTVFIGLYCSHPPECGGLLWHFGGAQV